MDHYTKNLGRDYYSISLDNLNEPKLTKKELSKQQADKRVIAMFLLKSGGLSSRKAKRMSDAKFLQNYKRGIIIIGVALEKLGLAEGNHESKLGWDPTDEFF